MNISWDNIDKLEDHYITYLLYKESRTVSQISKIRNLSTSQVNDQLIKAKLEIKSMLKDKVELSKDVIDKFLVLNKNDRLKFMDSLNEERMLDFKRKLYKRIMLNQRNDYKDEQKFIKEQLKKSMARTIKSKIRRVTKIRSIVGGLSDSLFIILCKVENIMGAKS